MSHRGSFAPITGAGWRIALAGALAGALGVSACAKPAPPPQQLPQVTVAAVISRDVEESDEFTGRLEAVDQVEVRPRITGFIDRVSFAEGKEVKKGDVLFVIDPRPYQATLDQAQAQLEQARTRAALADKDLERSQTLVAKQAISREEFDSRTSSSEEAAAAIRAAEAAVTSARLDLEWTRVRAPISGRVSRAEVTEGNLVETGSSATLLTTIVSLDPIYLYFDSDEQTYLRYGARPRAKGTWRDARFPVFMALANENGFPHKGYLDFVDNQINPATGTIRSRAVFTNQNRTFTPGLFARVKLVGGERTKTTLVRDAAIGTDQDRKFVLVLKGDSLEYRGVKPGRLANGLRAITSGVTDGEQIVVNGLQRVRPGMHVKATEEPMIQDTMPTTTASAVR